VIAYHDLNNVIQKVEHYSIYEDFEGDIDMIEYLNAFGDTDEVKDLYATLNKCIQN
jgi:ssDNA-specific exonuclease RecJ